MAFSDSIFPASVASPDLLKAFAMLAGPKTARCTALRTELYQVRNVFLSLRLFDTMYVN